MEELFTGNLVIAKKFDEIINGWKNYFFKNDKAESIAKTRLMICLKCEYMNERNRCELCGCFMPAKVRSIKPQTKCEKNKW